jgi:hypothetical protein
MSRGTTVDGTDMKSLRMQLDLPAYLVKANGKVLQAQRSLGITPPRARAWQHGAVMPLSDASAA